MGRAICGTSLLVSCRVARVVDHQAFNRRELSFRLASPAGVLVDEGSQVALAPPQPPRRRRR
jgi:hypothetical protein